jgi:mannose-6-phosphate isomerase-like protein (cupin superfamily)
MPNANKPEYPYDTRLDVLFEPLTTIDVPQVIASVQHPWFNQTLARVNDSVMRVGVVKGEYHWHEHANDDELFFVLEGEFVIDLEPLPDGVTPGRVVTLRKHEGFVVPRGVRHRTRSPERSVILMVENAGIIPTGD